MIGGQLALDGREVEHPPKLGYPLTGRQRELLRHLRAAGELRSYQAGVIMHAGREHPCPPWDRDGRRKPADGPCCSFATTDGSSAMTRLEARGLVERVGWGRWRATAESGEDWINPRSPSPAEVDRFVEMYERAGMTYRQIAEATHWEASTIGRHLRERGVKRRKSNRHRRLDSGAILDTVDLYGQGFTCDEVGAMLGISGAAVRYRVAKYGRDGVRHGSAAYAAPRRRRDLSRSELEPAGGGR